MCYSKSHTIKLCKTVPIPYIFLFLTEIQISIILITKHHISVHENYSKFITKDSMSRASACASIRGTPNALLRFSPAAVLFTIYHIVYKISLNSCSIIYKFHVYYCIVDFGEGFIQFLETPV